MASVPDPRALARTRLDAEMGTLYVDAPSRIALVYPSPYAVAMSSLGYQTIYRKAHEVPGRAAHRAFLPEDVDAFRASRRTLFTYETMRPVAEYPVVAFSVAYEGEIAGLITCLELAGIEPFAEKRNARDPIILAGGPMTFSNPLPLAPYVDAILMGEADDAIHVALDVLLAGMPKTEALRELARALPSAFVPTLHGSEMPPVDKASSASIPAYSQIITPNTELRSMFLVEP